MLQPAPHARFALVGDDLVVLNLNADRYVGLPGAAGGGDWTAGVDLHPNAVTTLAEAGLLTESDAPAAMPLTSPVAPCAERPDVPSRLCVRDVVDLLLVLFATGWRMASRRPCRLQLTSRTTAVADDRRLRDALARLDRLRLFVPTPRRCLPSALLTCLWLARRGCEAEIVFGVRSHPFEAHCWAEQGGVVLDDDLDRVRCFVPIAVSAP